MTSVMLIEARHAVEFNPKAAGADIRVGSPGGSYAGDSLGESRTITEGGSAMRHPVRIHALAAILAATVLLFAGNAHAIYIEGDLPLSLSFNDKNTKDPDSATGLLLTAGDLFLGLGVGFETYTAAWKASGGGSSTEINFQYLDIVWNAPVPVVNLTIGAGFGVAFPQGDLGFLYKQGTMSQFLVRVGMPIAKVFDVHVGYNQFSGKTEGKTITAGPVSTTLPDAVLDGNLITLGARFGF